eukprot:9232874-Karenia_brevis.AAC.1
MYQGFKKKTKEGEERRKGGGGKTEETGRRREGSSHSLAGRGGWEQSTNPDLLESVSYTHLRAHETLSDP